MTTLQQVVPDDLLTIVRCPIKHTPLNVVPAAWTEWLNGKIAEGKLVNRSGQKVTGPLLGALWNEDRSWLYPVYDYAAILIAEEAIAVEQLPEDAPPVAEQGDEPRRPNDLS